MPEIPPSEPPRCIVAGCKHPGEHPIEFVLGEVGGVQRSLICSEHQEVIAGGPVGEFSIGFREGEAPKVGEWPDDPREYPW